MKNLVMTPGPTQCSEKVRQALSVPNTNTDLDLEFFDYYEETCEKAKLLIKSKDSTSIIMLGEAILGLEAACASYIEKGDRVLVIDNGIFGRGFVNFVKLYGGEPVVFKSDYDKGINVTKLSDFINKNGPFRLATLVHCETPTGITNPLKDISLLLNENNIISIVDAVSSYGGEEIRMDDWKVDVLLAGTQKCLSVTSGGTIIFISKKANDYLNSRESAIAGYYTNIKNWLNVIEKKEFPYTHSDALINSINVSLNHNLAKDSINSHKSIANKIRQTITECGLELYAKTSFSNTLTAVLLPDEITFSDMFEYLKEKHHILVGGSLAEFENKIFRIGHMGENARDEYMYILLKALNDYFSHKGVSLNESLHVRYSKL
jgi:aspartate aminotransferase-like enzyme